MANLFNYVEKYGDITFKDKEFNDIDNLVFSLLLYLDFSNTNINNGEYSLENIGKEYMEKNKYKDISMLGIAEKYAYKLIKVVVNKLRYKDIILIDYIYNTSREMQFSALTFKISNDLKYICFEGTDELVCGWKEDAKLSCMFPIPSHLEAIKYVNRNVKLSGPKVIIGGHSKGGNLALISAMFMEKYKKFKVKKVYSNDGPGLREKEFESKEYKNIKKKYIHIVPDSSIVGVLLRNDNYTVVKSRKKGILGHSMTNWLIEEDKLVLGELSDKSKRLEKSIISWLDMHDDIKRAKTVDTLFKVLEDADIITFVSLRDIKNIIKIIRNIKNIDKQTKDVIIDFLTFNYKNTKG